MRKTHFFVISDIVYDETLEVLRIYEEDNPSPVLNVEQPCNLMVGDVCLLFMDKQDWLLIVRRPPYASDLLLHIGSAPILQPLKHVPFLLSAMWGYASCLSPNVSLDKLKEEGSLQNINKVLSVCQNTYLLKGLITLDEISEEADKLLPEDTTFVTSSSAIKMLFGLDSDVAVNIAFALLVDSKRGLDIEHKGDIDISKTIDYPESFK